MSGKAKSILYSLLPILYPLLPTNKFIATLNQKILMRHLWKTNPIQWRVEKARRMGAKVGENCYFYSLNMFSEPYLIEIGNNVIISGEVIFVTHDAGIYLFKDNDTKLFGNFGKIKVGNNCFIGMGAIILQNVDIGDNCIIGAGAVVRRSIPDNSVVIGNPAKVIFNIDYYRKMELNSKATLRDDGYAFPKQEEMPEKQMRERLLKEISPLPLKKVRK
jgi:acetyltransferase-like isoleucine patch superfamily enzyme